jgi:hypothetical protein
MRPRHPTWTLLIVIGVEAMLAGCAARGIASTVNPSSVEEMDIITAGASVEFGRATCGQLTFLSGRVVYRSAKELLPVADAIFWYAPKDGSARTELAIAVDADGRFEQSMGIIGAEYLVLSSDGSFPAEAVTGAMPMVVTARGCKDHHISYSSDWKPQNLLLDCPSR